MVNIYFFKFPLVPSLGGAEFQTLKLAKHLAGQGEQVKLFTSDRKLFRLFEKNRLPRKRLFLGWEPTSKWSLLLWPITFLIARRKFKKLVKEIPAGSVFFMQSLIEKLVLAPLTLSPSPLVGERVGVRSIFLEHKIPGRWLKLNPLRGRYLRLANQTKLVTVSNFAKQEFIKLGAAEMNIKVIYPGTPSQSPPIRVRTGGEEERLEFSRPFFRKGEDEEGVFTIGLLSRLDPEKGVYDFLKILIPNLLEHPNWKILIAGAGKDEDKIKKLINSSVIPVRSAENADGGIQFLGFVNDLDRFFSQISVLVYPSKIPESFGVAVLEAQTRGIPVVASKIGALPEIIEHAKNGFLVDSTPSQSPPVRWRLRLSHGGENKEGVRWIEYLEKLQNPTLYHQLSQTALASAQNFSETKMFKAFEKLTARGV